MADLFLKLLPSKSRKTLKLFDEFDQLITNTIVQLELTSFRLIDDQLVQSII